MIVIGYPRDSERQLPVTDLVWNYMYLGYNYIRSHGGDTMWVLCGGENVIRWSGKRKRADNASFLWQNHEIRETTRHPTSSNAKKGRHSCWCYNQPAALIMKTYENPGELPYKSDRERRRKTTARLISILGAVDQIRSKLSKVTNVDIIDQFRH